MHSPLVSHFRGLDIRNLCPPHAHLPDGSANFSLGSSGVSASLLDSPDDNEHPLPTDHDASSQETNTPLRCPVQTGVYLQFRPTFTFADGSRFCYVRPYRDCPCCGVLPHSLNAENSFPKGKEYPPTHHGQAAQRPQHECIITMPLLT